MLIAGGAVRDLILNQKPNDIDFVTNATPDEVIQRFGNNKEYSIIDHAKKSKTYAPLNIMQGFRWRADLCAVWPRITMALTVLRPR